MLSAHEREFAPRDRMVLGHREGDFIADAHYRSVIGTLAERQARYVKSPHLSSRDSQTVHAALVAGLGQPSHDSRKTTIWNQGTEMANHFGVTRDNGMKVYFCDPASPRQCGSNGNTNGLLEWSPVLTNFSKYRPGVC